MIFFEPDEYRSSTCTVRFTAKDGETALGFCDLLLHDGLADVVSVAQVSEDPLIAEGLLRAALNYAANRSYYTARFSALDRDRVRALLPFEQKDGVWQGDIPTLLAGTCGNN